MPEQTTPLLDRAALDKAFTYTPPSQGTTIPNSPFIGLDSFMPSTEGQNPIVSGLEAYRNSLKRDSVDDGRLTGGSIPRSLAEVTSKRYDSFVPGDYNNEDAYAQGQGWGAKMVNGVGKGLVLTGTTFLQSTVGLLNGVGQAIGDGRAASFYDNEFNRQLDEFNKQMEDNLPNYYTNAEKDARWYAPSKLFTANFFWDGIIKNMGFAAGAALSGATYAAGLKALPLTAKLFSVGKAAETLAATEEALLSAGKASETYGKVKVLSDQFLGSYNVLNTGGRAVVAGLATTGEAGFEAYHNLNEFRDQKIQEFKDTHFGEEPIGEDLNKINMAADRVGNSSFLLNTALLSATNYIQFPKILGSSYTAEKGIMNDVSKEIADVTTDATGKFIRKEATTRTGKLLSGLGTVGGYAFSGSEAFEEGAQFAISVGTKDYYNKQYQGDNGDVFGSILEGVSQTIGTDEGMENVLIGGLSGALMLGKGKYREGQERSANTSSAITAFNERGISSFTKETLDSVKRGVVLQKERETSLRRGDILESKDLETDYIINYLTPRIKYGRYDLVLSDIEDYKKLASTEEGFAQLQAEGKALEGDTRQQYLQRLSNLSGTVNNMKSLYQSLQLRYGNLITPDGKQLYSEDVMTKMIYAATKVADYDKRLLDLTGALTSKGVLISPILDDSVKGIDTSYDEAVKTVTDSKKTDIDETLILLKDAKDLAKRRDKFLTEYQDIKNNPVKHKEIDIKPVDKKVDETGKAVTINIKEGVDLEIGEEYYGGETFNSEEAGEKKRYTKFTVVEENDKGNVVVQTPDGKRHTITKSGLAKYDLTKTSEVKSKNAIAFIRGAHREFTYNMGKGKHITGTIGYNSKTDRLVFRSHDGKTLKPITREDLIPQKGYNVAKVYTNETLTPEEVENANQPVSLEEKLAFRNKVIVELYTDAKSELEAIDKSLQENQEALEKAKKDIEEVNLTKKGTARTVSSINKVIKKASKIKEDAETAISVLEGRKEELTQILPYLQDLVENSSDLPGSGAEMLKEMRDNISNIKEFIGSVEREIKLNHSLIESVNYVLKSAFETLQAAITKFKSANPNAPINIEGLRDQLERFLGEEGAQQFIDQKLGYTQLVADFQEAYSELEGDLKTPELQKEISDLQAKIGDLQESLKELQKEQKAKEVVLAKFEQVAERNRLQKEQEKRMAENEALFEQFLGTHSKEIEVNTKEGGYEVDSKKPNNSVINGTVPIDDGKPHQKRANTFGINLPKLKNRNSLRAIEVTAKTEALAGIPGLVDYLFPGATKAERDNLVAVVFVQDDGDEKFSFVDENGEIIEGDLLNKAIFQVRPTGELENSKGSLFRKAGSKEEQAEQDELKKRYKAKRALVLKADNLQPMKEFDASMGILEYEQKPKENSDETENDYGAKNTVEEAGLVTKDQMLENEKLIEVSTLNDPTPENGVSFKSALGRVLLRIPGTGLFKLNTTNIGKRKAESMYSVILQIAKNIDADPKNGAKNSENLFSWLKTVIYWGIPKDLNTDKRKDATYNNVWFEEVGDENRLFISGKGGSFVFTPSSLEDNKSAIVFLLGNLYHNVSNKELNKGLKKYREITSIDKDGVPVYKTWDNYQTYLLSKQPGEDAPLVTPILAIKGTPKQNRKAIYFVLQDNIDSTIAKPAVKTKSIKVEKAEKGEESAVDGVYTTAEGRILNYTIDEDGDVVIQKGGDLVEIFKKLRDHLVKKNPEMTKERVDEIIIEDLTKRIKDSFPKKKPAKSIFKSTPKETTEEKPLVRKSIFGNKGKAKPVEKEEEDDEEEETKPQKPAKIEGAPKKSIFGAPGTRRITPDEEVYRLQIEEEGKQFDGENWKQIETWLKANFPNLPVYRVKNIIQATNGAQAWGMLKDGAIYVYENAEVGTIYHEVFEGVWKAFTTQPEQESILKEFRAREGAFFDKFQDKTIQYKYATDQEAKEQLAEEFRDFVLFKKIPQKPESGRPFIVKLFNDIVDFVKTFFTGKSAQSNTEKLFEKIGTGYYKQYTPFDAKLAFANKGIIDIDDAVGDKNAEYRLEIPYVQRHELMQHMTYSILAELGKNKASLFNVERRSKTDVYNWLKGLILSMDEEKPGILKAKNDMLLYNLEDGKASEEDTYKKIVALEDFYLKVNKDWDSIVEDHIVYLKQYSVEFDENDNISLTSEEKDKGADGHPDARKVDGFRKANPAIKLLLSTIPEMQYKGENIGAKRSSIGGIITLPLDRVFISLKNRLYNSVDVKDMMSTLRDMAQNDINYKALYYRLTKLSSDSKDEINFTALDNKHDLELLSAFYKTMKSQNADVKIVYFLPSGEVEIGDAHLADATRQAKQDMFSEIVASLKKGTPYVAFNKERKEYVATNTLKNLSLKAGNKDAYIAFLKAIGITFTRKELDTLTRKNKYAAFETAVNGVKASLESISKLEDVDGKEVIVGVKDLNKYTINLEGRLTGLGAIRAFLSNPDFESTYFNISGDKTQTYIGTNVMSDFYDVISKINNIKELQNTPFSYLLADSFTMSDFDASTGVFTSSSVVLNSIFNPSTGNKKTGSSDILKTGIVEGVVDQPRGKSKDASDVTAKDRLVEELNLNSDGWFLNLVPGDASIEWMVKLHNEKNPFISANDLKLGWNEDTIFGVFRDYFVSELTVARGDRTIPFVKGRESSDLRFFKSILGEELHNTVTKTTKKKSPMAVYNLNKDAINAAVKKYIQKEANDTLIHLKDFGVVKYGEEGMEVGNLSFAKEGITEDGLLFELEALQANFMIANIELHKLVYSDPYLYKDELKRIKNFNSPAQPLMYGDSINDAINRVYNKGFEPNSTGWTNFGVNHLVSATISDVKSFIGDLDGYKEGWEETDGGGYITQESYRNIRIRSANWNEDEEKQYLHDVGYKKLVNSGARKDQLDLYEKKNPGIKSAYTPLKPIVRGSKQEDKSYNDVVLDKFALTPLPFRIFHKINPNSNAIKHNQRMLDSGVDYTVFKSGRKVGGGFENPIYDDKGVYMTAPFLETSDIPLSIISIQTEVPSKDKAEVTQGSQITKLATMDFMDAGVPLDYKPKDKNLETRLASWTLLPDDEKKENSPLYTLIKHNETLLGERIQHGYETLLNKLGIKETVSIVNKRQVKTFEIGDINKLVDTLTSEIYKREVNENIIEAFRGFKSRQVVLEATPAYQQIRNILYSIANRQVTRPTISGGLKVQIPSTLLESVRPVGNKEGMYESDTLKFYSAEKNEDGTIKTVNVAEIMVGRWFKSDLSDEALLRYLNDTKEGQKILAGVGYRVPTQKQNSIDVFKIKKFLPAEFGDSVVIPSALVKKAGSDFDIDKLSLYFKNTYTNLKGDLKIIPFFGYGEKAKEKFAEMYENGEFLKDKERAIVNKWIKNRKIEDRDLAETALIEAIFGSKAFDQGYVEETMDDFLDSFSSEELKSKIVNERYKQSLENEYIQSLEDLTSNPHNYEKLILPNSAETLKNLSKKIVKKLGFKEIDYTSVGNMLDRNFMERLRHAFVRGKYAIGIAATAQTNNAQNQRDVITLDYSRLKKQSPDDQKWFGDGIIRFKEFNKVGTKPTMSLARNAQRTKEHPEGQLISDIIGMFIDGYVDISKGPWIMELGATPNTASTWLFLIKLGVPIETVAYFMNQPIIREHLKQVENAGYSWIFNETIAESVKRDFLSTTNVGQELPSKSELEEMIGKKDLSDKEKAQQLVVFNEFFKYSKYAEQLFHVQQGSNFDTANINDPFIVFKKFMQLEKARGTMFDGVDKVLKSSFVGKLADIIFDTRDAFSTILISDKKGSVRDVLQQVLLPYIDMSDREFVKISQKAVFDLFDWAVQTKEDMNSLVGPILLGSEDKASAAEQVMKFVSSVKEDENHPLNGNYIIQSLRQSSESVREGKAHNLYLVGKNNKTYDQNNVIYGFNELRDYLKGQGKLSLYTKLVNLSILQSGLSNSKISFTQLLPYNDFKEKYNETLSMLDNIPNLQEFVSLNVFERNNWNNPDIVASKKSQWLKLKNPYQDYNTGQMKKWIKTPELDFLPKWVKKGVKKGTLPPMIQIGRFTKEGKEDFVALTWEADISKKKKQDMRKKGDYSYIKKGLFKKVLEDGKPVSVFYTSKTTGVEYESYLYKAINAWGDSYRANEFYSNPEQSVIDNGFIKAEEMTDEAIISVKEGDNTQKEVVKPTPVTKKTVVTPTVKIDKSKKINIYAGTGENADLSNFAHRPITHPLGWSYNNVEAAFQAAKINYSKGDNSIIDRKLQTATGAEAKKLGSQIKGLDVKVWDENSSAIMKGLIRDSFIENPKALQNLLATGDAELTHTQDTGKWKTEFPKLLMEVREELRNPKKGKDTIPPC